MSLRKIVGLLLSAALTVGGVTAAHANPLPQQETPTIAGVPAAVPMSEDARIKAWQDLRFGLFIHWGVYSTFGGYYKGQKQWLGYPEQIKAWGIDRDNMGIPDEDYLKAASEMTIPNFSATQWCQQAKDAGMKYLLVTSKHHDGFAMWDTKTTSYDFYEKAPGKRDPLKELADACNGMGIKLAFYFSIIDWTKQTPEPYRNVNPLDDEMMRLIHDQLKELLSGKYGQVPELWFDMGGPTSDQSAQMAQWVREFSPNTVINSRVWNNKGDFEVGGDNSLVKRLTLGPWESIRSTFPNCWGYCTWPREQAIRNNPQGVANQTKHEVENLFTTVANGGQYLLNIGPRGTGEFDPFEAKILKGIAAWNTRHPNVIHGAVPTYYPQQSWGYTVINGNAIYLGITRWPTNGTLRLPGAGSNVASVTVDDATAASPQALNYRVDNNDLIITLPSEAPDPALPVIKVETTGAPVYTPNDATTLVKGTMESINTSAFTTIYSPKGGDSKVIAYAKNESQEPLSASVSLHSSFAPETTIKVTAGATTKIVTVAELADGIAGFEVPARALTAFILEPAEKAYYADPLGGGRGRISRLSIGAIDTDRPAATIEHRFVAEDGSELPAEVMALLPKNRSAIPGLPQVSPSGVNERIVRMSDKQWIFVGWDHEFLAATGDTVVFTGTWKSGPLTYPVSYVFENITPDHQPPTHLEYLKPRTKEYARGQTVTAPTPSNVVVRDYQASKTWRFQGWVTPVVENIQGPVEIVGRWAYDRDRDVTVKYAFTSSDETALPEEVMELLPETTTRTAPVSSIHPADPEERSVLVPSGQWTFKGWDGGRVSWPAGPEHTYTGTWEFTRNNYAVTFTFRSADNAQELTEAIKQTLPAELSAPHGSEVVLPLPNPARFDDGENVWVFSGWEPSSILSITDETEVIGTWTHRPKQRFTPIFTFESATEGAALPAEILALLPTGEQYAEGETVVAPAPSQNTLTTPAGTWTFQGWTPQKVDNALEQASFVGKWSLEPVMHTVTYAFTSVTDKELPAEVAAVLPASQSLAYGTMLEPAAPAQTSFASIEGEWRFNGWNVTKETITGDLTVTGTWTYHAREFTAKITPPANLPEAVQKLHDPAAQPIIRDGKVCAPAPLKNEVAVDGGTWRFEGWEKECYTLDELAAYLTVNAQAGGAGGGKGAALFALKDVQFAYALPFVPVWKFHKKADTPSTPGGPSAPGGSDDGKSQGGTEQPGASGNTQGGKSTPQGGVSAAPTKPHLSMTGADVGIALLGGALVAAAGTMLLVWRRRSMLLHRDTE